MYVKNSMLRRHPHEVHDLSRISHFQIGKASQPTWRTSVMAELREQFERAGLMHASFDIAHVILAEVIYAVQ